ncbi:MAG: alpha/beta hydrolase [Candidatus Doudnabacteria bacterium]|nr:alpha/beta hydrolase [Candidatus Doudnabacteria bacterium]
MWTITIKEITMLKITSKDGATIAYNRIGNGPIIILVGGALQTKSDHLMGTLAPLLAEKFTVISYDRRGRGESTDTNSYSVDREIEDLEGIIREVGGSANIFGNSSGGNLALLAATKLPGITKIALYEAPFISEQKLSDATEYIDGLKKFISANQPNKALKLFFKRIGLPTPIVIGMSLTPMWRGLKTLAPTLVYDAIIVGDGSVPTTLKTLAVPTLAVTGDSNQMKQAAEDLVAVLPKGNLRVLEGQNHNVKADFLASALIQFFAQ